MQRLFATLHSSACIKIENIKILRSKFITIIFIHISIQIIQMFNMFNLAQNTQDTVHVYIGSAVERQSLASVLSPSCARPVADG